MKFELITTRDGSHSLYRRDLDEHYHSIFGAVQESGHIFIRNGFESLQKKSIQVFEMGFGTGLNALLSYQKSLEENIKVKYYSIEKFPVPEETWRQLNFSVVLPGLPAGLQERFHNAEWDKDVVFGQFTLHKIHSDILTYKIPLGNDLVYYDAFSPEKEPLLWSEKIFREIFESMSEGGIFMTYCSKGDVRRALISAGLRVEKLAGPPGKNHILRGIK